MDLLRLRQRSPQLDSDEIAEARMLDWGAPEEHGPAYEYEQRFDNARIQQLLHTLPVEQRLVVELKFFQHYTFEEISFQTGVSVNTVKSRLYASLQKMKDRLEEHYVL
jgi:RNA polymerase sigma-70 factor (ECF subfamily)